MMISDYITVETWNTKLQKVEYHYVHKSIKNPKQYVKSLHPEQVILQGRKCHIVAPDIPSSVHIVTTE